MGITTAFITFTMIATAEAIMMAMYLLIAQGTIEAILVLIAQDVTKNL